MNNKFFLFALQFPDSIPTYNIEIACITNRAQEQMRQWDARERRKLNEPDTQNRKTQSNPKLNFGRRTGTHPPLQTEPSDMQGSFKLEVSKGKIFKPLRVHHNVKHATKIGISTHETWTMAILLNPDYSSCLAILVDFSLQQNSI